MEGIPRGPGTWPYLGFPAGQGACTRNCGLQPATALIGWVTLSRQGPLLPLSQLTIEMLALPPFWDFNCMIFAVTEFPVINLNRHVN